MCGRFTLRAPAAVVAEHFALWETPELEPRFNVAPSQPVPVVRLRAEGPAARRELVQLSWGLVPYWAADPAVGRRLINARAETAAEKPAFRAAMRRRRCLVAADGFYEWRRTGPRKQPYFIRFRDDRPFGFAGLWESWEGPDHATVESCTLLTTEPNALLRPIHNRMPVILPPEAYAAWLDPAVEDPRVLAPLLVPCAPEAMEACAVGTWVNSPEHDDPECIRPEPGLFG